MSNRRAALQQARGEPCTPDGWQAQLGELWCELALARVATLRGGSTDAMRWAWQIAQGTKARLADLLGRAPGSAKTLEGECLSCAAAILEVCACVWERLAPVAGRRYVHLVRCLEERLEGERRNLASGEPGYAIDARSVELLGGKVVDAIEQLRRGTDPEQALTALEDSAVALAALATRAALSFQDGGTATASTRTRKELAPEVRLLVEESARAAFALGAEHRREGHERDAGGWLGEAMGVRLPEGAVELAADPGTDRTLRAEALARLRSRFMRLGACELLIIRDLHRELRVLALEREDPLGRVMAGETVGRIMAGETASIIAAARLTERPGAFDFSLAFERQQARLARAVETYCQSLRGDVEALEQTQRIVLARLTRVTLALWVIDARLGRWPADTRRRHRPPQPKVQALAVATIEKRLAQRVIEGNGDAVTAALALFERREPENVDQAVRLVSPEGQLPPHVFDAISEAWDTYRTTRDMPWD